MAYNQSNSQRNNDEVYFDLMEHIGVLATKDNGWAKEVNIVAWNGGKPKVDIRDWDPSHERMTKGITLFEEEAEKLTKALARRYGLRYTGTAPSKTFRRVEHPDRTGFSDQDAQTGFSEPESKSGGYEQTAQPGASGQAAQSGASGQAAQPGSYEQAAQGERPETSEDIPFENASDTNTNECTEELSDAAVPA